MKIMNWRGGKYLDISMERARAPRLTLLHDFSEYMR